MCAAVTVKEEELISSSSRRISQRFSANIAPHWPALTTVSHLNHLLDSCWLLVSSVLLPSLAACSLLPHLQSHSLCLCSLLCISSCGVFARVVHQPSQSTHFHCCCVECVTVCVDWLTMSSLARLARDAPHRPRGPQCRPYRYGNKPPSEFPPSSPPAFGDDSKCEGVLTDEWLLSLDCSALWLPTAFLSPRVDRSLLRHCPPPPFDCLSAGSCLHSQSTSEQTKADFDRYSLASTWTVEHSAGLARGLSGWQGQFEDIMRRTGLPALANTPNRAARAATQTSVAPPAPPSAPPSAAVAVSDSRGGSACSDSRRAGRGRLPPVPWPFFSRSSSYERTSWTSLSAAAANTANTAVQPGVQPSTHMAQRRHTRPMPVTKRIRISNSGVVEAVLNFKEHTVSTVMSAVPPAATTDHDYYRRLAPPAKATLTPHREHVNAHAAEVVRAVVAATAAAVQAAAPEEQSWQPLATNSPRAWRRHKRAAQRDSMDGTSGCTQQPELGE